MPESANNTGTLFDSLFSWLPKTGSRAISKLVLSLLALLFSLNLVVTPGVYPTGGVVARGGGKPIKAELVGHAQLGIPANRAVLTLRITSSGNSQSKVADDEQWAPIVKLSVNTVSSDLRRVNGFLLGEKDKYEAKAEVSATFEASQSLRWSLDDKTRKQVLAQIRMDAMQDAVDKLRAYVMPLLGKHVTVRAVKLSEVTFPRSTLEAVVMMDHHQQQQYTMYDELDATTVVGRGSAPHDEKFSLEPRVLDVRAEVDGEFEVSPSP
ncbi:hypothetical protein DV736_g2996, partial [Chaetothyriales sp. CBS 134916]